MTKVDNKARGPDWWRRAPFLPLSTEGCPPPGDTFVNMAQALGSLEPTTSSWAQAEFLAKPEKVKRGNKKKDAEERMRAILADPMLEELYRQALYDSLFILTTSVKNRPVTTGIVPGHLWGAAKACGPREGRSDVMVVGKYPGDKEMASGLNLIGPSGDLLGEALTALGLDFVNEMSGWYVTNLIKHPGLDPSAAQVPRGWIKDFLPVLYQELALVRPRLILCLGKEASEAVLGRKVIIKESVGRTFRVKLPPSYEQVLSGEVLKEEQYALAVSMTHPAAVLHQPEQRDLMEEGVRHFVSVLRSLPAQKEEGDSSSLPDVCDYDKQEEDVCLGRGRDWRVVRYADHLEDIVDEVIARSDDNPIIFIDCEWHGDHPCDKGSYLRSLQFSDRPGFACCVVLRSQGGRQGLVPSWQSALAPLHRLLVSTDKRRVRIAGHHLRADLPWVYHHLDKKLGLALLDQYRPAPTPERMRTEGGHDLMCAAHAYRETGFAGAGFKLENVCQSVLRMPRWNEPLELWKKAECARLKVEGEALEGYGDCPDEILLPYSMGDVDYAMEALQKKFLAPGGLLDKDDFGKPCWEGYYSSMLSAAAFLEMEMTGISVDKKLGETLRQTYEQAAASLLLDIRARTEWPEFNPKSAYHCRELLFGEDYNRKKTPGRIRPPMATSFYLRPVRSCGKGAKDWDKLESRGQDHLYNPSVDKEVLGILSGHDPVIRDIRRFRFLDQIGKAFLRPPLTDPDTGGPLYSDEDEEDLVYDGGILDYVKADGRIYSHFFPTTETGRTRSARPNVMNMTKRREKDYRAILGQLYKMPLRAMIQATPPACKEDEEDPWVLVDFDLKGAELMAAAVQSGDENMIDHTRRNAVYAEDHPDYYDIHSNMAVKAFKLNCAPTKAGLASIGKKELRDVSKPVVFGKIYGSGDERIVRALREEGIVVTLEEVEAMSAAFFASYPRLREYLEACHDRVCKQRFIVNCFGRRRRFPLTSDREALAKLQREAGNWPIQSCIADVVHRWMHLLESCPDRKDKNGRPVYRLILQIHDALLAECRVSALDRFCAAVHDTLSRIEVWPCDLDGKRKKGARPYLMSTDLEVQLRWGITLTADDAKRLGVPERYVRKKG